MGGDQHGLADGTGGEHLLPLRYLDAGLDAADHADHDGGAQEAGLFQRDGFLLRPVFGGEPGQKRPHPGAAVAPEHHEAPGKQFAVVGHTGGGLENPAQFCLIRAGAGHRLGGTGAAGKQEIQRFG